MTSPWRGQGRLWNKLQQTSTHLPRISDTECNVFPDRAYGIGRLALNFAARQGITSGIEYSDCTSGQHATLPGRIVHVFSEVGSDTE